MFKAKQKEQWRINTIPHFIFTGFVFKLVSKTRDRMEEDELCTVIWHLCKYLLAVMNST